MFPENRLYFDNVNAMVDCEAIEWHKHICGVSTLSYVHGGDNDSTGQDGGI